MIEPLPEVPNGRRSRAWLWVVVPIGLGLVVLLGGALAGLAFALRHSPSASGASKGSPSLAPPPTTAPSTPPPKLSLPSIETSPEQAREELDPSLLPSLPSSPAGQRSGPAEETAFLPIGLGAAIWGASDALVTLSVFGDLGCPHTRAALRDALRLANRFGPRLRMVFYHRPLDERASSVQAAAAFAGVALRSGPDAAWRALTEVARSTSELSAEELERWLSNAGSDSSVAPLAQDSAALTRVREDVQLAVVLGIHATPTLFVNGRRVSGKLDDSLLERMVGDEARSVRWLRAQGVSAEQTYVRRVRRNLIGVGEGAQNRSCVPADQAPVEGSPDALVTVVEFSDFQCQHCRALEPALSAVLARHPGLVRRVWRSFALPQHARAKKAAVFALAARKLGGERAFWAVHAALLSAPEGALGDAALRALASRLGLDGARVLAASLEPARESELEQDHELARSLGIDGAPTLFVNGRSIAGAVPAATLDAIVREELIEARRVIARGTPAASFEALFCGG